MSDESSRTSRILFVEDQVADVELALHHLKNAGIQYVWNRVETEPELVTALREFRPTVVLCDFSLPQFDGMSALQTAQRYAPEVPFLFLSGTIGEERAIRALRSGATDYVLKDNIARLAPAVSRAMADAAANAERLKQEALIARLNRVLRMLSGVNSLVLRIRDRKELLRETCRLAISAGGYAVAIASAKVPDGKAMQPVAWSGIDDALTDNLRSYVAESASRESSVISKVISTAKEFVSNNTASQSETVNFDALMVHAGLQSVVALPLVIDGTTVAVLVLSARDSNVVGEKEMEMLREVAGNLSFGLQYIQRDTTARFLSHFDSQTGLAKRSLFNERVQRLVTGPHGRGTGYSVVVMDIERLSIINDSFGRRTGDLLLQHVADRLKRHYPKTDQIAHFGGGTFALIRAQSDRKAEIGMVGHRQARTIFGEPFQIEGSAIPVAVRTGFALFPEDAPDPAALVQNAEAALHVARATGRKHVRYSSTTRSEGVGQFALEHRLRLALERQEFELFYQPKVSVITRRIQGAEALIRWRSPEDGLVSPSAFLPLLESAGLMVEVGDWVIRQAARDCQRWLNDGLPPIRVAVNISPAQLLHPDFVQDFLHAVEPWSTTTSGLDVEITEGVLQEESVVELKRLKVLRDSGVKIAIDDFGTGYSSLRRLAALPIDTLKIDKHFVAESLASPAGASLVKTIIELARTFNMTTVAALIGVDISTARRWRRDRSLPQPVHLLGHILTTGDLGAIHPGWAGWKLHQGELSGPNSRRPFTATELDMHPITVQRVSALEATVRRQEIELQLLRGTAAATPEKLKLQNAEHRTWQIERLAELMLAEFGVTVHECVSEVDCATSVQLTGQIDSAYKRNDAATTAEAGAEAVIAALDAAKRIRALCRQRIDLMASESKTCGTH